ncbi:MAG: COQ9 family protein [Solirubrobacterales bacterium]
MSKDFREVRDRLVMAALPHVVFDGWSRRALAEAARDEGLDATIPDRAFPGGPIDAVEHFADMADRVMLADLAAEDLASRRVPDRIFTAIRLRLERWAHHREAIRRALALMALPQNAGVAARATFKTVDAMWHAAGDSAHDFSWYTKRATLAAVYSASVLYWLDDGSEDLADTWGFVRRRLADVGRVTQARKRLETVFTRVPRSSLKR